MTLHERLEVGTGSKHGGKFVQVQHCRFSRGRIVLVLDTVEDGEVHRGRGPLR